MTPLFAAITHGCAAERDEETFNEVYMPRIARGKDYFATVAQLGLYGQELAALANFFEIAFVKPSSCLSASRQALVLNLVGYRSRGLGRLEDAAAAMRAAVQSYTSRDMWDQASLNASALCQLLSTIGQPGAGKPEQWRRRASGRSFADRCGNTFLQMGALAHYADALFQAGWLARAEGMFYESENTAEGEGSLRCLASTQRKAITTATSYCPGGGVRKSGHERPMPSAWPKSSNWLLEIGLDTSTLARAALAGYSTHCACV